MSEDFKQTLTGDFLSINIRFNLINNKDMVVLFIFDKLCIHRVY